MNSWMRRNNTRFGSVLAENFAEACAYCGRQRSENAIVFSQVLATYRNRGAWCAVIVRQATAVGRGKALQASLGQQPPDAGPFARNDHTKMMQVAFVHNATAPRKFGSPEESVG